MVYKHQVQKYDKFSNVPDWFLNAAIAGALVLLVFTFLNAPTQGEKPVTPLKTQYSQFKLQPLDTPEVKEYAEVSAVTVAQPSVAQASSQAAATPEDTVREQRQLKPKLRWNPALERLRQMRRISVFNR